MTLTKKTTHADEIRQNAIEQFKRKANFQALTGALAASIQGLENAFFELIEERALANAVGDQLDGIGDIVGVQRGGLSDSDFRAVISGRIKANASGGTVEDLIDIVKAIFGASVTVVVDDTDDAEFTITVTPDVQSGQIGGEIVLSGKAAGVRGIFQWQVEPTAQTFVFDDATAPNPNPSQGFDDFPITGAGGALSGALD